MKHIKTLFNVCVLVVLMLLSNRTYAQTELENYISIAGENNPKLQSLFQQYMATLERLPQAKALPNLNVAFGIFISPVETRVGAQRANLSVSQMFPWFGQLKAQENVVADLAQARFQEFEDAKNKLQFEVRFTYNNLYVLKSAIDITEENINLLNTFRALSKVKFESAKGSFANVLRIDMEVLSLQSQLDLLRDNETPIKAKFRELLNTDLPSEIIFPDTLWVDELVDPIAYLKDSILLNNPLLAKYDYEMSSFDNQIEVAKSMGKPTFSIGMSYINVKKRDDVDIPDNGKDAFMLPQIGLSIPIFGKRYESMEKEKALLKESVRLQKENKENQLQTDLEVWYKDYRDAARRAVLYQKLTGIARQTLSLLVSEYSTNGSDFEELLRMDRQLLKYELELEKARADRNTTIAYINYLTGK
jgi:outer membrane protein, heavy metal efflux system